MRLICGIDEAGRGPLAGPLVAVAVVAPEDYVIDAVDSKKISARKRETWVTDHKGQIQYFVELIDVPEINQQGIGWANREIFQRLIRRVEADYYIVDGNLKLAELGEKTACTECRIRADESIPLVSAASILAKTIRDDLMRKLHEEYPHYYWASNKGYGTRQHISALKTFGASPHHREDFVKTVINKPYAQPLMLLSAGTTALTLLAGQFIQSLL
ncbi:MAG: ribonuclease HII [Anaerolineae bacterium]|jgi:ribonuclease HII|nr:ribonuclease HII [Anaerolineae bacterium]